MGLTGCIKCIYSQGSTLALADGPTRVFKLSDQFGPPVLQFKNDLNIISLFINVRYVSFDL